MKQVVVMRQDLKMSRADVASCVARASSMFLWNNREETAYDKLCVSLSQEESEWFYGDQKISLLEARSEWVLRAIADRAEIQGLTTSRLTMSNEDEKIAMGSALVCVAIGPHEDDVIDSITGNFKLA